MLDEPLRALAPQPSPPRSDGLRGTSVTAVSPFQANAREERETREQRAEWFIEHDALSSPAPHDQFATWGLSEIPGN